MEHYVKEGNKERGKTITTTCQNFAIRDTEKGSKHNSGFRIKKY